MRNNIAFLVLFIGLMLVSCSRKERDDENARFHVVTTTGMIADLVQNIAGEHMAVQALMGPGVDPHLYKATQGDIMRMGRADVIFYNGLHLEGKMIDIFKMMQRKKRIVPVAEGLPPEQYLDLQEGEKLYDPHIWFDVSLWRLTIPVVVAALSEMDPEFAAEYHRNGERYAAQLDSLHQWVMAEFSQIPPSQRVIITAHDAFGYLGRAYELEVHGLQGISTIAEYGVNDVTRLVDLIIENRIKAVFVETSVSQRAIEAVVAGCKARGHPISIGGSLYSDAMGGKGSGAENYLGMVGSNVKTIVQALK